MLSSIYEAFTKNKLLTFASLLLVVYLLPYYILGEDTHIRVHDNMDSNIVWYKLLAESGLIFASPGATLPNIINGLPRSALSSSLDLMTWLYVWFEPFTAYTINQTIMRFVALFGMYWLLAGYFFKEKKWISAGVALAFAFLPFWPSGALSIAGMPLALYAFLKIRKYGRKAKKRYWLLLLLIPFHSNFIVSFVFFLSVMGFIWLWDWIRTKRFHAPFFLAISMMTVIFLIKNYMVIYTMFINESFTPHRVAFELGEKDFSGALLLAWDDFLYSHTHDTTMHYYIILPAIMLAFILALSEKRIPKLLLLLTAANAILSLWYGFWYWEGWRVLKDEYMILNTFNFSRYHFLSPLFWYISFGLALSMIAGKLYYGRAFVTLMIIGQVVLLIPLNEEVKYSRIGTPTFQEFYSVSLFEEIKNYIGKPASEYEIVSIGMHPTIAQFNGMYTLDTYNTTYPLSYKKKLRKVIKPELEKNETIEHYFDTWGSRLYIYVAELGKNYMFTKQSDKVIQNLELNTKQLEEMGGDYILSAVPIKNHEENNLKYLKTFENSTSIWQIYLYKIS
ncbi:DUF6044 family protein [Thalassobacillus pellis]|uniref:DUF6044 family protein n=1 Tax=Thalassobacillus pellis TaxID=748008 RepID=UPI00196183C2|nr:DUF6044 family protein [Thalassobacillus pellis]MBM7553808.1 hypothetical protein [Thalassobacillus pellis]